MEADKYTVYHYSGTKFDLFDKNKSDGLWFTDISPEKKDIFCEIGADGCNFAAKCEITINEEGYSDEFGNHDMEEQFIANKCDGVIHNYDGFVDYCVREGSQVKILEWIKL